MAGFHDVISKLDGNRQILTDGNVDIPFRSFIVDTLMYVYICACVQVCVCLSECVSLTR